MNSTGQNSTLYNQLWLRAIDGFVLNLEFDAKSAFSCQNCGRSPKYFVGDGKCTGPLQKKLEGVNVHELSSHPDDKNILPQGSKYKERVFISDKKENDEVRKLLTGDLDMTAFLNSGQVSSLNGQMIQKLVCHISAKWPLKIPDPYINFIADISKASSVAGLLQVLSAQPLKALKNFATEKLNIRSAAEYEQAKLLEKALPAFWPLLISICELEKTQYLPSEVSNIVLELISIRKKNI